ncbi:unnamed protein product [marine sediment metagenome]|uniref:Uncharacterized protein n=1 Tax=marine sediment metagenome TaxID=412755 RepID=X1I9M0_9ZZZZ
MMELPSELPERGDKEKSIERKLTPEEALQAKPKTATGVKLTFKKEPKKDKIKKIIGDKLKGIIISGEELTILVEVDDLSDSDKAKIQKIVDGE